MLWFGTASHDESIHIIGGTNDVAERMFDHTVVNLEKLVEKKYFS